MKSNKSRIVLNFVGLRSGGGRADAINLLIAIPRAWPAAEFMAVVPKGCGYNQVGVEENVKVIEVEAKRFNDLYRLWFDNLLLKQWAEGFNADVIFTMGNTGPVVTGRIAHVVMLRRPQFVYNLKDIPGMTGIRRLRYWLLRLQFQASIDNAAALVVQTQTMRELVEEKYRVNIPISVVPKTVSGMIRTTIARGERSQRDVVEVDVAEMKLLFLSKYYPHKNIERGCSAVALAERRGLSVRLYLTLSAEEAKASARLLKRIERGDFGNAVVNLGPVDLVDLPGLYHECDATFMPSMLESFSATYIEAMAYGRPALASDCDFAREILGDAAIYFDATSVENMAAAIEKLYGNDLLRDDLVEKGRERYRLFNRSWDDIAEQYVDVLANCV